MRKSVKTYPVSRKAYERFVERINSVVIAPIKRTSMLRALEMYLDGDRTSNLAILDDSCVMAFAMLKFDIDAAISRSEKARTRAREKKAAKESTQDNNIQNQTQESTVNTPPQVSPLEMISSYVEPIIPETVDFSPPKSRHERRAELRKSTPKNRWRKL